MVLYILNNFVNRAECHRYTGIGTAVVDSDASGIAVAESSAGECNVLNVAYALVDLTRIEEVFCTAVLYLPGLVDVKNASAEAVNEAVAALKNAVIEYEPAFACLDRDRTCADLLGLPASERSHNVSVVTPVSHIVGLGNVHVAERSMTAVGRTAEHNELVIYLSREEDAVSVEGEECVLALVEFLEILCPAHTDSRLPAVSVAPCDPESVLDPYTAGIVAVLPRICLCCLGIIVDPVNTLFIDVPVDPVLGEAGMDSHISLFVVNSENACELVVAALEGNYCAVEDGVAGGEEVSRDYRVSVVSPDNVLAVCGLVLPRDIGSEG